MTKQKQETILKAYILTFIESLKMEFILEYKINKFANISMNEDTISNMIDDIIRGNTDLLNDNIINFNTYTHFENLNFYINYLQNNNITSKKIKLLQNTLLKYIYYTDNIVKGVTQSYNVGKILKIKMYKYSDITNLLKEVEAC